MDKSDKVDEFLFEDSQITYRKAGNGPAVLLAFHGFGQNHTAFSPVEMAMSDRFTVYSINLFFHGSSRYTGTGPLTKTNWSQLIDHFLQAQAIDRFSLMGFSLGGRFALATAEAFADRLDQLVLIAPDGITLNRWYWLATDSRPGRWLFQYTLRHLSMLTTLGHALTTLGLLNRTVMRFAETALATPEQRKLVYESWTQFRQIHSNMKLVAKLLNEQSTRVRFFTGAFDRIVPGFYILPLTRQLRHYELTVLKTGHNRLIELMVEQL
ncbi:alpha/beta hydrolase [Spirosoma radiotolerans]|uniref:Alpha/beta hydrolase n=1 Tax=Spirosoma radiotolerans TaxID=1379870 RepID=A0A0E4A0U3_9BACT|nr:alpha/beta hydrolase [Spirosoma radiotolerans]AKD58083.1 alpha/beta hydrolase [Spirosoma radiotolerans]